MRILNPNILASHGNRRGREALVQILEAGLQAADPCNNTRKLLRVENGRLIVGNRDFDLYSALLEKSLNCGKMGAPTFSLRCSHDHTTG
jgi:hypothetical protein